MIINADSRRIPLADKSVQCVVTSPPYFGLRDYDTARWEGGSVECDHKGEPMRTRAYINANCGTGRDDKNADGHQIYKSICGKCGARRIDRQIGLEQTPAEYVAQIVAVMRECWRVLKPTETLFLNLGDSYFSSSVRSEGVYGTSGKALGGYPSRDCLCGNLCGVCRTVYQSRKSHSGGLLVAMLVASLSATNREHTASPSGHPPTLDSSNQEGHSVNATLDSLHIQDPAAAQLRASLASMIGESSPQLLAECWQRASRGVCLLCARSLPSFVEASEYKKACQCEQCSASSSTTDRYANTGGSAGIDDSLADHISGKASHLAYPYSTTPYHLKPKDLIGIPWRVALALQDDGWYLRSDIVWHKPNPMPESVTDRPTKAHEYVFLLAKNGVKSLIWRARDTGEWSYQPDLSETIARADRAGWKPGTNRAETFDRSGNPVAGHVIPGQNAAQHRERTEQDDNELIPRWRGFDYYYNAEAIAEPAQYFGKDSRSGAGNIRYEGKRTIDTSGANGQQSFVTINETRNARSVWTIATQPYAEAHFATFPEELPRRCILAGSRPGDLILDPFSGSGTTEKVATELGRRSFGLELSREYIGLSHERTTTTYGIPF